MTRFMVVACAIALVSGCAGSKKDEAKSASGPSDTAQGGGANTTTNPTTVNPPPPDKTTEAQSKPGFAGGVSDVHQDPQVQRPNDTRTGGGDAKPLDPSANADPNSPKQQARTTGLLGATSNFDDSPVDLQYDAPDDPIKALLANDKATLTACHKTGGGILEIELTVDANGKVTAVKFTAASTLKDATARACVTRVVKKWKLDKGTKPSGAVKIAFPK
jgi:hypothetical protein